MQENNFEKEVKQVMQEFSITPSDNLWQQVKADLDEKRKSKRRWWFAAMIFCACLMLPSLLLNDLKKTNHNTANNIPIENSNNAKTEIPGITIDKQIKQTDQNKNDRSEIDQEAVTIAKEKSSVTNTKIETIKEVFINQKVDNKSIAKQSKKTVNSAEQFVVDKKKAITVSNGKITENNEQEERADIAQSIENAKINPGYLELVSLNAEIEKSSLQIQPLQLPVLESLYKTPSGIKKYKSVIKSKSKGYFEISATAARFSISDNSLFSAVFTSNANKAYDLQSANLNGGVGIADTILSSQSYIKNGYTFSLGVSYAKQVTKKTSVSAGAGFRYGNTKLISESYLTYAGPLNNLYSRSTGIVNLTNHFYFIDIPVQIQSLIGSGKKLPMYWNVGLQYSYLIRSSNQQYNAIQNSYRSNILTKSILGISAGLDVELFKNKKTAFKIGPSLYYSFSKAAEKDLYKNMHYHFEGIRIKKSL